MMNNNRLIRNAIRHHGFISKMLVTANRIRTKGKLRIAATGIFLFTLLFLLLLFSYFPFFSVIVIAVDECALCTQLLFSSFGAPFVVKRSNYNKHYNVITHMITTSNGVHTNVGDNRVNHHCRYRCCRRRRRRHRCRSQ